MPEKLTLFWEIDSRVTPSRKTTPLLHMPSQGRVMGLFLGLPDDLLMITWLDANVLFFGLSCRTDCKFLREGVVPCLCLRQSSHEPFRKVCYLCTSQTYTTAGAWLKGKRGRVFHGINKIQCCLSCTLSSLHLERKTGESGGWRKEKWKQNKYHSK